jgi:hypothetical protein
MKELFAALAKAQAEIGTAAKSSENPHFRSKYADLSEVWAAWQEVGPKNGLAVMQTIGFNDNGQQWLSTILGHTSGEQLESRMLLTPTKNDMQGIGSALTYARRYALAALVGIVQDDDDGQAASSTPAKAKAAQPRPEPPQKPSVDNWIAGAKAIVDTITTGAELSKWEKDNEKALDKLDREHPEKFVSLTNHIQNRRDALDAL